MADEKDPMEGQDDMEVDNGVRYTSIRSSIGKMGKMLQRKSVEGERSFYTIGSGSRNGSAGDYENTYKIILLGDTAVGKSNLLLRFTRNSFFTDHKPTIGVEFFSKTVQIQNNKLVKAQIWDTAGQERYQFIASAYYRESVGVLLVYDVSNRKSFDHIPKWLKEVELHCDENCLCILVGNKSDLDEEQRQVTEQDGKQFAEKNGMAFVETSALTAVNVGAAFHKLIKKIYSVQENLETQQQGEDQILSSIVGMRASSIIANENNPIERIRSRRNSGRNSGRNSFRIGDLTSSMRTIHLSTRDSMNIETEKNVEIKRCCGLI